MSKGNAQGQITPHQSDVMDTPSPIINGRSAWNVKLILITWMAALGFDFLWHGGILAEMYTHPSPALINPELAFIRIPFGYGSLLTQVVLVYWFFSFVGVNEWQKGLRIGFMFGSLTGFTSILGQYSILALELDLLTLWGIGQVIGFSIMGAVLGAGISVASLKNLATKAAALVVIAMLFAIILQSGFH